MHLSFSLIVVVLMLLKPSSAGLLSYYPSDIIKTDVVSPDPNAYFDLPAPNTLSAGETIDLDNNRQYLLSCQYYAGVKVQDACIFIKVVKEHWTDFLSIDTPSSGQGDFERPSDFQAKGRPVCNGGIPKDAVCRVKGEPLSQFRNYSGTPPDVLATRCSPVDGLVCQNSDQTSGNPCHDYEIKFLCPRSLDPTTVKGTIYRIENLSPFFNITSEMAKRTVRRMASARQKNVAYQKRRVCFTKSKSELRIDVTAGRIRRYYEVYVTGTTLSAKEKLFIKSFVYVGWVDTATGELIQFWEQGLMGLQASGIGGNMKTGDIHFGREISRYLDVMLRPNLRCQMENSYVKTINNHQQDSFEETRAHEFDCTSDNNDEVNGAFSPLNDAHVYGTETVRMFRDYYNIDVVPKLPVVIRVHYRENLKLTYWDPIRFELIIGDGNKELYPLSGINVIPHELAHGFTQTHSNLLYRGEPGAVNEAYSDITGETLEHYLTGKVDWKVSYDVVKSTQMNKDALRYFECPGLDGASRGHYHDYKAGDDVHEGSGIYNRAFMVLSRTPGWGIKKAHQVFTLANFAFWRRCTTMASGACGVEEAARTYGYDNEDVARVFNQFGVKCPGIDLSEC